MKVWFKLKIKWNNKEIVRNGIKKILFNSRAKTKYGILWIWNATETPSIQEIPNLFKYEIFSFTVILNIHDI